MNQIKLTQDQEVILNLFLLGRQIKKRVKHRHINQMLTHVILVLVSQLQPTLTHLSNLLAVSLSTLSEKIATLQNEGFIKTTKGGDRRHHHLALTPKGHNLLNQFLPHFAKASQTLLSGLNSQDKKILIKGLNTIETNLTHLGGHQDEV